MDSIDVLPFAAATSTEPGQQTLFRLDDHRAPLPPAAAISLGVAVPRDGWDNFSAYLCFLRIFTKHADYDEQRAYELLIDAGCPSHHADAAWDRFAARVRR